MSASQPSPPMIASAMPASAAARSWLRRFASDTLSLKWHLPIADIGAWTILTPPDPKLRCGGAPASSVEELRVLKAVSLRRSRNVHFCHCKPTQSRRHLSHHR
jgi:hypothetical protein